MQIIDVLKTFGEYAGITAIIVVLGSIIKIEPLKINLWSWIARKIGNALNHDVMTKVDDIQSKQNEMESKLDNHISQDRLEKALEKRQLILQFSQQILRGEKHTKEQFDEILSVIDEYEDYCDTHPNFPNNRCLFAIELIKSNYRERLEKADFLAEDYREKVYSLFEQRNKMM